MPEIPPDAITFFLGNIKLSTERLNALVDELSHNNTLQTLNLYMLHLSDKGTASVVRSLINNTSLTKLSLNWNTIGIEAAHAIAQLLINHNQLTTLSLCDTEMNDTTGAIIAQALVQHCALQNLMLRGNPISTRTFTLLVNALRTNGTLQGISFLLFPDDEALIPQISTCLSRNASWKIILPQLISFMEAYQKEPTSYFTKRKRTHLYNALNTFSQQHAEQDESLTFSFQIMTDLSGLSTLPSIIKISLVKYVINNNQPSILYINFAKLKQALENELTHENSSVYSSLFCLRWGYQPLRDDNPPQNRQCDCVLL